MAKVEIYICDCCGKREESTINSPANHCAIRVGNFCAEICYECKNKIINMFPGPDRPLTPDNNLIPNQT